MIFVTGATGFLGSYVVTRLVEHHDARVLVMVRSKSQRDAVEKLWKALQLHMDGPRFLRALSHIEIVRGDLLSKDLGMSADARRRVTERASSVLHIAASLNRKSEKECLNVNLRGTLSVIRLAREIAERRGGLDRFSDVSTIAVGGKRQGEVVTEDAAIEWDRSDYDPYARTKKFCEHMIEELLPDVPQTVFRPSAVMGDTRFVPTTQFDMVRAFVALSDMPVLPMDGACRQEIVNADWVGKAIADIHLKSRPKHRIYNLSAGTAARSAQEIAAAMLASEPNRRPPRWVPRARGLFQSSVDQLAGLPRGGISRFASLFKVFWPYITNDTVYDNRRAVEELGEAPTPFTAYCGPLYRWSKSVKFEYPYRPLPSEVVSALEGSSSKGVASWA
jgi:nucleoside-diphosphate-sugar epimerase